MTTKRDALTLETHPAAVVRGGWVVRLNKHPRRERRRAYAEAQLGRFRDPRTGEIPANALNSDVGGWLRDAREPSDGWVGITPGFLRPDGTISDEMPAEKRARLEDLLEAFRKRGA